MPRPPARLRGLALALLPVALLAAPPAGAKLPETRELRSWIEAFKSSPKGPFLRIRWFCGDGSVHPPKPYPCTNRGDGIQHGELNDRAKQLRAGGYAIANVLAELEPGEYVGAKPALFDLRQVLLERFLIGWDDGWIFRGARTYRGALQIEDEEAGSRAVVAALVSDRGWKAADRFLLLRETVRLLPLQSDEGSAASVRKQALVLASKDKDFTQLRAKIHNQPDAGDAARVRGYAKRRGKPALKGQYERLASDIDALYAGGKGGRLALALAPKVSGVSGFAKSLKELGTKLEREKDPAIRVAIAARLMGLVRKYLPKVGDAGAAIEALQLSIVLETDGIVAGTRALPSMATKPEGRRLELLDQSAEALYGAGLLDADQLASVKKARKRKKLGTLSKPPTWAQRALEDDMGDAIRHLAPLEPETPRYVEDRLQLSLLPFYRGVLETLGR